MADILNIGSEPIFNDRVVKIKTHTYNPYANTTFGHSDEIRIPIQLQDLYTLPCENFLYVKGRLTIKRGNDELQTTLGNNCVAFMFDEIRYCSVCANAKLVARFHSERVRVNRAEICLSHDVE